MEDSTGQQPLASTHLYTYVVIPTYMLAGTHANTQVSVLPSYRQMFLWRICCSHLYWLQGILVLSSGRFSVSPFLSLKN